MAQNYGFAVSALESMQAQESVAAEHMVDAVCMLGINPIADLWILMADHHAVTLPSTGGTGITCARGSWQALKGAQRDPEPACAVSSQQCITVHVGAC